MLYNLDYSIEKPPTFKRLYNHDYCTKNFPYKCFIILTIQSKKPRPSKGFIIMTIVLKISLVISALKIHVSKDTKEALDKIGTFELQLRGVMDIKVVNLDHFVGNKIFVYIIRHC